MRRLFFVFLFLSCFLCISCTNNETDENNNFSNSDEVMLLVTKESSHKKLRTVHPGDDITYTFTLKNDTSKDECFEITDKVPDNTSYKCGDGILSGKDIRLALMF